MEPGNLRLEIYRFVIAKVTALGRSFDEKFNVADRFLERHIRLYFFIIIIPFNLDDRSIDSLKIRGKINRDVERIDRMTDNEKALFLKWISKRKVVRVVSSEELCASSAGSTSPLVNCDVRIRILVCIVCFYS